MKIQMREGFALAPQGGREHYLTLYVESKQCTYGVRFTAKRPPSCEGVCNAVSDRIFETIKTMAKHGHAEPIQAYLNISNELQIPSKFQPEWRAYSAAKWELDRWIEGLPPIF